MSAYIFVSVEITIPIRYEDYRKSVLPTIEKYGAASCPRRSKVEVLEGNWPQRRIVIVEFPSPKSAPQMWKFSEYAAPKSRYARLLLNPT